MVTRLPLVRPAPSTVTGRDLARAEHRLQQALQKWNQSGRKLVEPSHVRAAEASISQIRDTLRNIDGTEYAHAVAELARIKRRQRLTELLLVKRIGWLAASLCVAVAVTVPTAILLVGFQFQLTPILLGTTATYLGVLGAAGFSLRNLEGCDYERRTRELNAYFAQRDAKRRPVLQRLDEWETHLRQLLDFQADYDAMRAAQADFDYVQSQLSDERVRLLAIDWRSLRGIPFEDFLGDVFRLLGYSVQTTRASGDQGADLIIERGGRRLAVQAKGYANSVGNAAIQEVYAGQAFYHCHGCVAITNSSFTTGAQAIAAKVNCMLIDNSGIPDLIRGHLL